MIPDLSLLAEKAIAVGPLPIFILCSSPSRAPLTLVRSEGFLRRRAHYAAYECFELGRQASCEGGDEEVVVDKSLGALKLLCDRLQFV